MAFWKDVASAVAGGLAGSSNPYLSSAGGILGGGGGSGPPVSASPPPPPPPPPQVAGGNVIGSLAESLGVGTGVVVIGGLVLLVWFLRKR